MLKKLPHILFLSILSIAIILFGCREDNTPPVENPPINEELPGKDEPKETVIRVATYNVQNLFDTVCDTGRCGVGDYEKQFTNQQLANKLADLSKQILSLKADVIFLQEIETEALFNTLIANTSDEYVGVFGETGWAASVDVGIMVRGRLLRRQFHRENHPFVDDNGVSRLLARELVEVEAMVNGQRLILFNTHFISKVSDAEGGRRQHEGRIVREILDQRAEEHPHTSIIFGGDLNDYAKSETIQTLIGDGVWTISSHDIPLEDSYTWNNQADIDHLIFQLRPPLQYIEKSTQRHCNISPASGLGSSDHCALSADFLVQSP